MPSTSKHLQLQLFACLSSCFLSSAPASAASALDANVPRDSNQAFKTLREALAPLQQQHVAHPRPCAVPEAVSALQPVTAQRAKRCDNSAAKQTGGAHA